MYDLISDHWKRISYGIPATEKQQRELVRLGWGRDNLTLRGAAVIIREIKTPPPKIDSFSIQGKMDI